MILGRIIYLFLRNFQIIHYYYFQSYIFIIINLLNFSNINERIRVILIFFTNLSLWTILIFLNLSLKIININFISFKFI